MALLWTICMCALLSVVLSASPNCEELIKPLDMTDPTVINGKWVLVACLGQASAKWQAYMDNLSSSWGEMSASSEDGKVRVRWADRMAGQCIVGDLENQLSGNKVSSMFDGTLHEGEYLQTCPDCLLMTDVSTENDIVSKFLFLSRRVGSTVTEGELETVKKQAQCLGIAPTIHTFATDYCPLGTEDNQN